MKLQVPDAVSELKQGWLLDRHRVQKELSAAVVEIKCDNQVEALAHSLWKTVYCVSAHTLAGLSQGAATVGELSEKFADENFGINFAN